MSEPLGTAVICEQCEDVTFLHPAANEEMLANLEAIGWRPYGTGVTPLADENAKAGRFECRRCTNELVDQLLNRLAGETVRELNVQHGWMVIRSADTPSDYLRILSPEKTVQLEIEHFKTDREMRDALRASLADALGLK
jgi:hypothetical protein